MRALQIVDAKIVRSDPEHPVATYWAGEVLEGPAAELQVALGHAYALPELAIAEEAAPEAPARQADPAPAAATSQATEAPKATVPKESRKP